MTKRIGHRFIESLSSRLATWNCFGIPNYKYIGAQNEYQREELISDDEEMVTDLNNTLTEYQGKSRAFGAFNCSKCNHRWNSTVTWSNWGQKCKICRTSVFPYDQIPIKQYFKKFDILDDNYEEHCEELCDKCQFYEINCMTGKELKTSLFHEAECY
ncbi:hypothetical protein SNEBB_000497 [Seison nebaliae]|nr:hypothetical protein SNEBB_000497 [Seison nebaliae]